MAPFLDGKELVVLMQDDFDNMVENNEEDTRSMSVWTKDKDNYIPSTNISIVPKLEPGLYSVIVDRNGMYCKKLDNKSDELFIFSDSLSEKLVREINNFWDKSDKYLNMNLIHKRGILLEGFPGTGKSSIITILSDELIKRGGVVFKISGLRNFVDYIEFITTYFRKIEPDTPVVTIIEDIDQYAEVEIELLDFLDGKTNLDHHVLIATSNNTEAIPETFLRPSRIDLRYEVCLPNETTRAEYFRFKEVPEEHIPELVEKTDNFSIADLKEVYICIYVLDYQIDDAIAKIEKPNKKKNYLSQSKSKGWMGI